MDQEKKKRVSYDTYVARAVGGLPKDWAQAFGLGSFHSFSINKYKEHAAAEMALETTRRLEHYFAIYLEKDDVDFHHSAEEIDSYEPGDAFFSFALAHFDHDPTWNRCQIIMNLKPCNLGGDHEDVDSE